jgi:magnesium-transporting ATPase (P-type)
MEMEMEGFPMKFFDRSGQKVFEINNQKELIYEMLQIMAICHECIIEKKKDNGYIHYQGQSPDEIAIVDAARHIGFKFLGNDQKTISLDILETNKEIEVLQSFEFNSNRKRMSMIIREKSLLKLYMKGADSKIKEKLDVLSKIGMRVLCFAMRIISVEEYEEFLKKVKAIDINANREEEISK